MTRLIIYLIVVAVLAAGLAWLADRPGTMLVEWEGYRAETSVFRAVVILMAAMAAVLFLWSLVRQAFHSPVAMGRFLTARRGKRGLDALSNGMIAVGSGDSALAARYALQARKTLPDEPLTHLLRAQAAQMAGDRATAKRIFEAMLAAPDTEQLGLRGLFAEAERDGDAHAARLLAERAFRLNPKLAWPAEALFDLQCRWEDWRGALDTLSAARKAQNVSRIAGDRRRAVLLTAMARTLEDSDSDRSLGLAMEAHGLAPGLIPAAVIAGRLLSARGNTLRAARVIEKTWARTPHPDLAHVYAYARIGDSPRDRLQRVRHLAALTPHAVEAPIAVATAAIEARAFDEARTALEPFLDGRLTQRMCLLMAHVEAEQNGQNSRAGEWMARAVTAARDPEWTADGVVADAWAPLSPATRTLDGFQWRVPVESADRATSERLAEKLAELAAREPAGDPIAVAEPRLPPEREDQAAITSLAPGDASRHADDAGEEAVIALPMRSGPDARDAAGADGQAAVRRLPSPAQGGAGAGAVGRERTGGGEGNGREGRPAHGMNGSHGAGYFPSRPPDDPGPARDSDEDGDPIVEDAKRSSRY